MDTIQNFFGSLKGQAIKYEDQVLDAVEAGIDHVELRAKQLKSSLASLSSLEARQAALTSLKRQAKDIESMFKEDETKKFVSGGVASYVHSLERALEARVKGGRGGEMGDEFFRQKGLVVPRLRRLASCFWGEGLMV